MKRGLQICLAIYLSFQCKSQLVINPNATARELAEQIVGFSGYVKTASLNCANQASGSFTNGDIIQEGAILTTGLAVDGQGPNNGANTSTNHGTSGDSDLDILADSFPTLDACILEFEVIPYCTQLDFSFSFASEEYDEYVGRAFNDVFGFFVSGPNPILGLPNYNKINIAELGGVQINVNSINAGSNPDYYTLNTTGNSEYDGMTVVISKSVAVTPCATYKIKLGVADGFDGIFDAAVLLEAYDSVCAPSPVYTVKARSIDVIEGCEDTLKFERSIAGFRDTLNLQLSGSAANVVDIPSLTNSIIFDTNDLEAFLLIDPSKDGVYEGLENLKMTYSVGHCGIIDTANVYIQDELIVSAGADFSFCSGDSVELQGFVPNLPGITYFWTPSTGLDDSTLLVPTVTLINNDTAIANYNYILNVMYNGCLYTDSNMISVFPNPDPDFDYYSNCDYDSALLIANTNPSTFINHFWNFGDGYSGVGDSVYHVFNLGNYNVKLTAVDTMGCLDSITKTINIHPSPTADFTFVDICEGQEACFNDVSTISAGTIVSRSWNINGVIDSIPNPCVQFNTQGLFNVELVVESALGCINSVVKVLRVNDKPTSNFSVANSCEGDSTFFNNYSLVSGSILTTNLWDFGDGTNSNVKNPTHIYAAGTYNVQLITESQEGCRDTITRPIEIYPKPSADFAISSDTLCELGCIEFYNLSQHNADSLVFLQWDFGDQFFSNKDSAIHCYDDSGDYNLSLVVRNNNGCSDSANKIGGVKVLPNPEAYFSVNRIDLNDYDEGLIISDSSSYSIVSYFWDFGDGNFSNNFYNGPFSHDYDESGDYKIVLTVENVFGCESQFYRIVYYKQDKEIIYVPNVFTPDNDGKNDGFGVMGVSVDELENFEFLIFDRWGRPVFKTYEYNNTWDGTVKGSLIKEDVYVWQLTYTQINGETKRLYGTVTLLK